jgi:hypothetical protein
MTTRPRSRLSVTSASKRDRAPDDVHCPLKLLAEHRSENGVVHLHYGLGSTKRERENGHQR